MLKKLCTVALLGTSLVLAACSTTPVQPGPSETITQSNLMQLQHGTWILTHIGTMQVTTKPSTNNIPSLQFAKDGRVSGADGCNRLMGGYTAGRETLSLSQLASTQMACMDKNYVPQKYVEALGKVTHYVVYNKTLKLTDKSGNVLLQFSSAVQPR
ncbi:META domain-containing protein [uncultured Acinetobacter sp.]|uniref:META domain-containing protein n=1 Tax=uncultured Acinetobacter sp. TaxID=165433 RepID=UPI002617AD49|nr:META domain-containing protein [uncultured Acinetobacter sp.]